MCRERDMHHVQVLETCDVKQGTCIVSCRVEGMVAVHMKRQCAAVMDCIAVHMEQLVM